MCLQCFTNYIEDALTNQHFILHSQYGYTIQWPAGCDGSEVKETEHFRMFGPKKHEQYQFFATYESLRQMGGIYCPAPGCGNGLVPKPGQIKVESVMSVVMYSVSSVRVSITQGSVLQLTMHIKTLSLVPIAKFLLRRIVCVVT